MSMFAERRRMTLRDYVSWEEAASQKHEFRRGEVRAMAGATIAHNIIASNILGRLHRLLESHECRPFGSDLRVRINAADVSTYPDISVVCGELKPDALDKHAITNPRVIFEVLSRSTFVYDRFEKFETYQRLESFREYIVVYQTEAKIIHYSRQDDDSWRYRLLVGMEATLQLDSIPCELPFDMIYRAVEFGPEPETAEPTPDQRA